jgi:hypothetical protein
MKLGNLALHVKFLMEELLDPFEKMHLNLFSLHEVLNKVGSRRGSVTVVSQVKDFLSQVELLRIEFPHDSELSGDS